LTDGALTAEMPDGSVVDNILTVGASYARPVGVEHNIINNNDSPYSFIEVELK
jgi:mannose-6-phosphate isomerase-like protein (cupin superfamily)